MKQKKKKTPQRSRTSVPTLLVLMVCASTALYIGYAYVRGARPDAQTVQTSNAPTPTPTPTPIRLAPGKGEYTVSHRKSAGPRVDRVVFDPLDVKKGETLVLSTTLFSDTEITSVTGALQSDTTTTELLFTKTGVEKNAQIWSTQLTIPDTLWYTYIIAITATNTQGSTTVQVAPRS